MPAANIDRGDQEGTGELPGRSTKRAPMKARTGGVAIYVEVLTDNKNRTTSEVRHIFSKYGGNWARAAASPGCSTPRGW